MRGSRFNGNETRLIFFSPAHTDDEVPRESRDADISSTTPRESATETKVADDYLEVSNSTSSGKEDDDEVEEEEEDKGERS